MGDVTRLRPPTPPPDRGKLLGPSQVAELIGGVSPTWVRRHIPYKLRLGHNTVRWYERHVREWLESTRDGAA